MKKKVLLAYALLLAVSTAVRLARPDPPLPLGVQSVSIAGHPRVSGGAGVQVAYQTWQGPDTETHAPVLLLHGSPGSGRSFGRLGDALGGRFAVLAPDLPGFGASTRKVPDYSVRAHAQMMLQMMDSLGVRRAHVLGFSMGGGVALEMARAAPERVASLILLSAIGTQEFELLGDYHLNHAIHALQLVGIGIFVNLTPHFGGLDRTALGLEYARNFFDTDQRPLRGVLQSLDQPTLIVHGDEDSLVPKEAAMEHHRLVPQSDLVMIEGDHFMAFARPEVLSAPIADFLDRVERGEAATRSLADPDRLAQARQPFDPASRSPAVGFALFVTILLIAAATFVSEDLACIGAGLLIARGSLPWIPGVGACLVGIWVGDLLLYGVGRFLGRPVVERAPLRWFVGVEDLDRSSTWFERRGAAVIFSGRFVPGTRLPTYVAAGVVRMSVVVFALWALAAATVWTPLLVGGAAVLGGAMAAWLEMFRERAIGWLVAMALVSVLLLRLVVPMFSNVGRRALARRWCRIRRWEFWPAWLFYPPIVLYVLYLGIRYRSPTLFTAVNPGIPGGGFAGESKAAILERMSPNPRIPRMELIPFELGPAERRARALAFKGDTDNPVVLKPDVGERGAGVAVVRTSEEVIAHLDRVQRDIIVQEYVPGEELGVFYVRHPHETSGRIFAITTKKLPSVVGDGTRTLEQLVLDHPRFNCQANMFLRRLGSDGLRVPGEGETVQIGELGDHARGAEFGEGSHLASANLLEALDDLTSDFHGFHFGRFDVRGPSIDDIQAGQFKVLELNGASSEATNIYDPENSLLSAYRTLFEQWRLAFEIGDANRAAGTQPTSVAALLQAVVVHMRPGGARWQW